MVEFDLTAKQSLKLSVQRAVDVQMVRLFEVWSANVHQIGEAEATENFCRGLDKLAKARTTIIELIDSRIE